MHDSDDLKTRHLVFKLYRLLNLCHVCIYTSSGKDQRFSYLTPADFVTLGLATRDEARVLEHTKWTSGDSNPHTSFLRTRRRVPICSK